MNSTYKNIKDTRTFADVLDYIKSIRNTNDIIVFLDWDDNIADPDTDEIIEPKETKALIDYMKENRIMFNIITGRFYNTACNNRTRKLKQMERNILKTIHPVLMDLDVDVSSFQTEEAKNTFYKLYDENQICIGILYMGIIFSGYKGLAMKDFMKQAGLNQSKIIFVDDYEQYLYEATTNFPGIKAYRRFKPLKTDNAFN